MREPVTSTLSVFSLSSWATGEAGVWAQPAATPSRVTSDAPTSQRVSGLMLHPPRLRILTLASTDGERRLSDPPAMLAGKEKPHENHDPDCPLRCRPRAPRRWQAGELAAAHPR